MMYIWGMERATEASIIQRNVFGISGIVAEKHVITICPNGTIHTHVGRTVMIVRIQR